MITARIYFVCFMDRRKASKNCSTVLHRPVGPTKVTLFVALKSPHENSEIHSPFSFSLEQQTEILYQEVQVFLLAPALMWCMWAVVRSQDTDLSFGFWVSLD